MFCRVSLFLAFVGTIWATDAPAYRDVRVRDDTLTTTSLSPTQSTPSTDVSWTTEAVPSDITSTPDIPTITSHIHFHGLPPLTGVNFTRLFLFPVLESTAAELEGDNGLTTTPTDALRPQMETSRPSLNIPIITPPAGDGIQRTVEGPGATYAAGQNSVDGQGNALPATNSAIVVPAPIQTDLSPAHTVLLNTILPDGQPAVITTVIPAASPGAQSTPAAVIEIDGAAYNLDTSSHLVIDGQTASAGGAPITVANTVISIFAGGLSALVGTSTLLLASATPVLAGAASLTIGSRVITTNSAGGYVVSPGLTLSAGGSPVTIDNTAYALKTDGAGGTVLVARPAATTTTDDNARLANYIAGALTTPASSAITGSSRAGLSVISTTSLGQANKSSSGSNAATTTNSAAKVTRPLVCLWLILLGIAIAFS